MNFREANGLTDEELAEVLDFADTVSGWIKSVRSEAFKRALRKEGAIPGWKLTAGATSRDWKPEPEQVPQLISAIDPTINVDDLYHKSLISVPQAEALLKRKFPRRGNKELWQRFEALVNKTTSGSQSLVRETDGRPATRRGQEFAKFANIDHESQ